MEEEALYKLDRLEAYKLMPPEKAYDTMHPEDAYELAMYDTEEDKPYWNLEKLQEIACQDPYYACAFARNIPGADIAYCQEKACEYYDGACSFAKIPGADISYCQKIACEDPEYAYKFAERVPGANIAYCQKHACKSPSYAVTFAEFCVLLKDWRMGGILEADVEYSYKHADRYGKESISKLILKFL